VCVYYDVSAISVALNLIWLLQQAIAAYICRIPNDYYDYTMSALVVLKISSHVSYSVPFFATAETDQNSAAKFSK
jgi:hypothetical protein